MQDLNIRDYLRIVRKRMFLIISIFIITSIITVIYTFTRTPIYTASTKVLIERNESNPLSNPGNLRFDQRFVSTQNQIIRSTNVAKNVVKILSLDTVHAHHFFPKETSKLGFIKSLKKSVKSFISDLFNIDKSNQDDPSNIENQEQIAEREKQVKVNIIAGYLKRGLEIMPISSSNIIELVYSDTNPVVAQMIVSTFVKAYMEEVLEINMSNASRTLKWMAKKAEEERVRLEKSERALQKYMQDRDMITIGNRIAITPERLTSITAQLTDAQSQRDELEERVRKIESLDVESYGIESLSWLTADESLTILRQQILANERNIEELSKKYGEKHPAMIKARSEKKILQNKKQQTIARLIETERNNYELAQAKVRNLTRLMTETKKEALFLNENLLQHSILQREVESNRILYQSLLEELKVQRLTNQEQSINVWVIEPAGVPGIPSKPNKKKFLMLGLFLGLLGGLGLAFGIEYLDNTVKSAEELEKRFGFTVLGTILQTKEQLPEKIVQIDPLSVISESYKAIRTSILLSSAEKPPKTILISSMSPKEGKSTVSSNLAATIADNNFKVVLVDCDLRKSRVHKIFELNNQQGLSTYLAGASGKDIVINESTIASHSIIPAGPAPPNPAELLGSRRFKELIGKLEQKFDFVILDSPPIMNVTDSLLLSKLVDAMVIVCRAGKTNYEMLDKGMKVLANIKANILGYIINGIEVKHSGYYYYGYDSPYVSEEME